MPLSRKTISPIVNAREAELGARNIQPVPSSLSVGTKFPLAPRHDPGPQLRLPIDPGILVVSTLNSETANSHESAPQRPEPEVRFHVLDAHKFAEIEAAKRTHPNSSRGSALCEVWNARQSSSTLSSLIKRKSRILDGPQVSRKGSKRFFALAAKRCSRSRRPLLQPGSKPLSRPFHS